MDIFDKLIKLPILKFFEPYYHKYKELLLYLFFGGFAFFLNIGLFAGIDYFTEINELINNSICWVVCVFFQFFTNRKWVFEEHETGKNAFFKQLISFIGGRIFTLIIEEIILGIFITWLCFNSVVVKLIAQVIVISLNYIISKMIIFKK